MAQALAEQSDDLRLDGVTVLSPEVAKALAKHEGTLRLNGLETISAESADALSKHDGELFLNGLTSVSDEAARHLPRHIGRVHVSNLPTKKPALIRRLDGTRISAVKLTSHARERQEVDHRFLPKHLERRPPLLQPFAEKAVVLLPRPFGRDELTPDVAISSFAFCAVVYRYGITQILVLSMQPNALAGRPNRRATAKAMSSLMDPANCFMAARDTIWAATSSEDAWEVVDPAVLSHEEARGITLAAWTEETREGRTDVTVPRVVTSAAAGQLPDDTKHIKSLTPEQAVSLAQRGGMLALDGLPELSSRTLPGLLPAMRNVYRLTDFPSCRVRLPPRSLPTGRMTGACHWTGWQHSPMKRPMLCRIQRVARSQRRHHGV